MIMYVNKLHMFMPTAENVEIMSCFISRCTFMSKQFALVDQVSNSTIDNPRHACCFQSNVY